MHNGNSFRLLIAARFPVMCWWVYVLDATHKFPLIFADTIPRRCAHPATLLLLLDFLLGSNWLKLPVGYSAGLSPLCQLSRLTEILVSSTMYKISISTLYDGICSSHICTLCSTGLVCLDSTNAKLSNTYDSLFVVVVLVQCRTCLYYSSLKIYVVK